MEFLTSRQQSTIVVFVVWIKWMILTLPGLKKSKMLQDTTTLKLTTVYT